MLLGPHPSLHSYDPLSGVAGWLRVDPHPLRGLTIRNQSA